uniref:Thymidine kinase n=1 Tax=Pasiphaea japonica whispovirus TaxID=2984286 RepID=A0A9C7BJD1_9VIRU|nr:MAG: thymidine kinase [Pasiphaea japonica whispovirus]
MEPTNIGKIHLVIGPMFAGKSSTIIKIYQKKIKMQKRCVFIKHVKDNRYGCELTETVTHSGQTIRDCVATSVLSYVDTSNYDYIFIDEGQFFSDLGATCKDWAIKGKRVTVAALDGNYEQQLFPSVIKLIPICDKIEKLSAVCMICNKNEASLTKKYLPYNNTGDDDHHKYDMCVGGTETYCAVCIGCANFSFKYLF